MKRIIVILLLLILPAIAISHSTRSRYNKRALLYGAMYIPGVDIVVPNDSANPFEVKDAGNDGWAVGELNDVTFPTGGTEHYLTITKQGRYEVVWSMSAHTGGGGATAVHGGVMIDGVAQRNDGEGHRDVANANDDGNYGSSFIVDCPNGTEEISLWCSTDNSENLHVEHGTMTIKLINDI